MNWHETIEYIRDKPEYSDLIKYAYYERKLEDNIERFRSGEEFLETVRIIKEISPTAKNILEIGAGNGIAAINFALLGYQVTAVEPDSSDTVGAEAIKSMISFYRLSNIDVLQGYGEELRFDDEVFDIVYIRQAMHHAGDLGKFITECARVLKKGGVLFTVRDHVIFDPSDKEWFLQMHPLHRYYSGENAYSSLEYRKAMQLAGLKILKELKHFESVLNYFPITKLEMQTWIENKNVDIQKALRSKIGILASIPFVLKLYKIKNGFYKNVMDERKVPGRMYSYIARKTK